MYDAASRQVQDQVGSSDHIATPARIRIGSAGHGYIYNWHGGFAYRCERGPDGDKDGSRLWLMKDPANNKWVALVIIGYGTLLVSQSTWAG